MSKIEPIFFESTAPDSYGREQKIYIMNRDGFTLLAMGFTGSDAIQWKIKYIKAFNEMEKQLNTPQMTQTQIIAAIAQAAAEQEQQLKQIAATQTKQAEELQGMRDVISLDTTSWREDYYFD